MTITHDGLWRGIDRLAASRELSVSALARKAGLDPTVFNKSKRVSPNGRLHWPGTESLVRIMEAAGCDLHELVTLIQRDSGLAVPEIPALPLDQAQAQAQHFDRNGYPLEGRWGRRRFLDGVDRGCFAVEIQDDRHAPVYRSGALLIAAPDASIRKGDRALVCCKGQGVSVLELSVKTMHRMEFSTLGQQPSRLEYAAPHVLWMTRIVWASQ